MEFYVDTKPIAQPRPRARVLPGGFAQIYTPDKVKDRKTKTWRPAPIRLFRYQVAEAARDAGAKVMFGAIDLRVTYYFKKPKKNYSAHFSKPDLDNLLKGLLDALTGVCWEDDCQVARIEARKVYAQQPGVNVWITEMSTGGLFDESRNAGP